MIVYQPGNDLALNWAIFLFCFYYRSVWGNYFTYMFSLHMELMLVTEEAIKKGKKIAGFAINIGFLKEQKAIFS